MAFWRDPRGSVGNASGEEKRPSRLLLFFPLAVAAIVLFGAGADAQWTDNRQPENGAGDRPYLRLKSAIEQRYGLSIDFRPPDIRGLEGKEIPEAGRVPSLQDLEHALDAYPPGMVARFVSRVVLLQKPKLGGAAIAGLDLPGTLVFSCDGKRRAEEKDSSLPTLFHRHFFHLLDRSFSRVVVADKLAAEKDEVLKLQRLWDDYRLFSLGSYAAEQEAEYTKKARFLDPIPPESVVLAFARCKNEGTPPEGFAMSCGRVSPYVDRATIAEALLDQESDLHLRINTDRDLGKKVELVRRMFRLASLGAMGEVYWDQVASGAFKPAELFREEERNEQLVRERPAREPVQVGEPGTGDSQAAGVAESADRDSKAAAEKAAGMAHKNEGRPEAASAPERKNVPMLRLVGESGNPPSLSTGLEPGVLLTYRQGLEAFQAGNYREAEKIWLGMFRKLPDGYVTIQIAVNCRFENVMKNYRRLSPDFSFYALPFRAQGGQPCHMVFAGLFAGEAEAARELDSVRRRVAEGRPVLRKVTSVRGSLGSPQE